MSSLPRTPHSPHIASWQLLELSSVLTHNSLTSVPSNSLLPLFFIPASHIDRTLSSVQCGTLSSRTGHTHKCHFPSHLHMTYWWLWSLWIPVAPEFSPRGQMSLLVFSICQDPKEVALMPMKECQQNEGEQWKTEVSLFLIFYIGCTRRCGPDLRWIFQSQLVWT